MTLAYITPKFRNPYPTGQVKIIGFNAPQPAKLASLGGTVKTSSGAVARYYLLRPYVAHWKGSDQKVRKITVPAGMLTDLASIPVLFRPVIPKDGPWRDAAVLHDFMTIAWRTLDGKGSLVRRDFADNLMAAAMQVQRVDVRRHFINLAIKGAARFIYPQSVNPATQRHLYVRKIGAGPG